MSIRKKLTHSAAHTGHDSDEGADSTASDNQHPVSKAVLDSFHHAADFSRAHLSDASPFDCEVDDFRDSEETDGYRHQGHTIPKVIKAEGISRSGGVGV